MANDGFNYSEYLKYVQNFGIMKNEFDTWLKGFLLQMAQRAIARIKPRTPVDTGALRNSWTIGSQHIELIGNGGISKSGKETVSIDPSKSEIAAIKHVGDLLEVTISNPQEYASFVEYGTKGRQGVFMMTISVNEIQQQVPARFKQEFQAFLKSKGVG